MNVTQAQELVTQVQTAHRLAVGFYQRLLPLLTRIAGELELQFWYWEPTQTGRPCSSTTSPDRKWKWDFVPLFASRHVFWRIAGEQAQQGDVALDFELHLDEDFKSERRKALGIKGEADPLILQGSATAEIYLFRCMADNEKPFDELWNEVEWPSDTVEGWHEVGPRMNGCRFAYTLAQLIAEPEAVIADIQEMLAEKTS